MPLDASGLGYATPIGQFTSASAVFQLGGLPSQGDYIVLAWLDQQFNYRLTSADTLETSIGALAAAINQSGDGTVSASASGTEITLTYAGGAGANANRVGVYATVFGANTETWSPGFVNFSGCLLYTSRCV